MESEATINFKGLAEAAKICKYFLTTDERLKIHLKTDEFFPNEKVHGIITFHVEEEIKPNEIRVEVKGLAKTSFYVQNKIRTINSAMNRTNYYFTETYLNFSKFFWKPSNKGESLKPGNYEFPFDFTIPEDAPPSMQQAQGKIQYSIKAIVESSSTFSINSETKAGFFVLPYLNLNVYTKLDEPQTGKIEKTKLLSSKHITATAVVPKTGYATGEEISLKVEILNETSLEITAIESGILQTFKFIGFDDGTKSGYKNSAISTRKFSLQNTPFKAEKNKKAVFSRSIPVIPEILPTLESCSNIAIEYDVFVEIQTNAYVSSTSKTSLPIIIGTVPLEATVKV